MPQRHSTAWCLVMVSQYAGEEAGRRRTSSELSEYISLLVRAPIQRTPIQRENQKAAQAYGRAERRCGGVVAPALCWHDSAVVRENCGFMVIHRCWFSIKSHGILRGDMLSAEEKPARRSPVRTRRRQSAVHHICYRVLITNNAGAQNIHAVI